MGYKKYSAQAIISISPVKLEGELDTIILNQISDDFEGIVLKECGVVIAITDVIEHNKGEIVPGDPNVFFKVEFEFISYLPQLHEVVNGVVTQVTDFGAFIKIGPFEGLCHISQIMEDFNSYNPELPGFVGKESKQHLIIGDEVLARIANVSLKSTIADTKIGLTMRQFGLGKEDWINIKEKTDKTKKTKKNNIEKKETNKSKKSKKSK
jgi:DNA-directed RNA polymerase subunit E'